MSDDASANLLPLKRLLPLQPGRRPRLFLHVGQYLCVCGHRRACGDVFWHAAVASPHQLEVDVGVGRKETYLLLHLDSGLKYIRDDAEYTFGYLL